MKKKGNEQPVEEVVENETEPAEEIQEEIQNDKAEPDCNSEETTDDSTEKSDELENELNRVRNDYLRLYAEYDNYRKRTAKEKTETYSNASSKCIENLLPVIDSFERSLECECTDENFKNGMSMIFNQMKEFLNKMNVKELDALGAEFDPNFHNAIQQISDTDYASNHICAVYQKGYVMGDKLIRPAMVAVATD